MTEIEVIGGPKDGMTVPHYGPTFLQPLPPNPTYINPEPIDHIGKGKVAVHRLRRTHDGRYVYAYERTEDW